MAMEVHGNVMRITIDGETAESLRERARGVLLTGDLEGGLALLAEAQASNPLSADVHFDKAVAFRTAGRYDEALQSLAAVDMLESASQAKLLAPQLKGDVPSLQRKPEEALLAYEQASALNQPARFRRGCLQRRIEVLCELDRFWDARTVCIAALKEFPEDEVFQSYRAQIKVVGEES